MPKLDLTTLPERTGTGYPAPHDTPCQKRHRRSLSQAGNLTQFGAHIITLPQGEWSSQRHWHSAEDELIYIISGHPTLFDDSGEVQLSPGDVTTHPANDGNGHHMINKTDADVVFLIIGTSMAEKDTCHYPDIDLHLPANGTTSRQYQHKDGTPYSDNA